MPMWAAAAVVAVAYLARTALRGWDFRLDLPLDLVMAGALVALIALRVALARAGSPLEDDQDDPPAVRDQRLGGDPPSAEGPIR